MVHECLRLGHFLPVACRAGACRIAISPSLYRSTLSVGVEGFQEAVGSGRRELMEDVAGTAAAVVVAVVAAAGVVGDEGLEDTRSQDTEALVRVVETKTGDVEVLEMVASGDLGEEVEVVVAVDSSMVLEGEPAARGHRSAEAAHYLGVEVLSWEVRAQVVTGDEVEDASPNLDGDVNENANQSFVDVVLSMPWPFPHPYQAHAARSQLQQSPNHQK